MKHYYTLLLFIIITATAKQSVAQPLLKPEDFKVYFDNFGSSDTIITMSKSSLLKAKGFKASFSWIHIKQVAFYILLRKKEPGLIDDVSVQLCPGDKLCNKAFEIFKKLTGKEAIIFDFEAEDKNGRRISLPHIQVHIADN